MHVPSGVIPLEREHNLSEALVRYVRFEDAPFEVAFNPTNDNHAVNAANLALIAGFVVWKSWN